MFYPRPGRHFIESIIGPIEPLLDVDHLVAELVQVPLQHVEIVAVFGFFNVAVVRVQDPHDQICSLFFHGRDEAGNLKSPANLRIKIGLENAAD